jgi:hypothetical protein
MMAGRKKFWMASCDLRIASSRVAMRPDERLAYPSKTSGTSAQVKGEGSTVD